NSPQAGILAVGEIADRPVVRDGQVVPGKVMEMTLSCDHRILYGAEGAQFLQRVCGLLEEPAGLLL
ncbi:MAG: 2-oxo acid dehydrogenase subunit E2, partial [Actinobacteria bacterium]|nr:2-oxo acid dehydrogenase subunit E2 [Actinomycetota bacterium]